MAQAKIKVICPYCDTNMKTMKEGDKDQGGEAKCKGCDETVNVPKILVLKPIKESEED